MFTMLVSKFSPKANPGWSINIRFVDSIKSAAKTVAYDMVSYYTGNDTNTESTIAVLPSPYYWWEAGGMWGAMIDYWYYTGDASYNSITYSALLSQIGPSYDFIHILQRRKYCNDTVGREERAVDIRETG